MDDIQSHLDLTKQWADTLQDPEQKKSVQAKSAALLKAMNKAQKDAQTLLNGPKSGAVFEENKKNYLNALKKIKRSKSSTCT